MRSRSIGSVRTKRKGHRNADRFEFRSVHAAKRIEMHPVQAGGPRRRDVARVPRRAAGVCSVPRPSVRHLEAVAVLELRGVLHRHPNGRSGQRSAHLRRSQRDSETGESQNPGHGQVRRSRLPERQQTRMERGYLAAKNARRLDHLGRQPALRPPIDFGDTSWDEDSLSPSTISASPTRQHIRKSSMSWPRNSSRTTSI